MLPSKDRLTVCFAHVAYGMQDRFALRNTMIDSFQVRSREELDARLGDFDVLVCSGMWRNDLIGTASRLKLVQSISAGTDQYDKPAMQAAGIRLASAAGVNARAVSEHAMALILALSRRLPDARDNQHKKYWRGMQSDHALREDELGGKTVLVVGLGKIGNRLAHLAKAFDMRVVATRRDPAAGGEAHEVHGMGALKSLLPQADYVVLTCPLTPETEKLMNAETLALMKPGAALVNMARGRVVDEAALIAALQSGALTLAAIDVVVEEPLPEYSPLWSLPNVFMTPHTGGETRRYEDNVLDILLENLDHVWRGEALRNQIV
ncbi:MAG TPA: D-2-hydroxyacid dehydrogenase [Acetobacteraceae bacterium]|jgi:D-2-hydroxyacid dehydrogenase (NADP+)|nr:D-2-hydroxyacid dehydrogenase [Acetobacteraceae bacterium]